MNEDSSSGKDDVVARAEAELRAQSLDEPNWEAMAERVMSALPQAGATEAALLDAPLPTQADEIPLDLASSTRVKGAEPSLEFGAPATLDDSWTDLPGTNEGGVEEPPFTAVAASTAYVATETAVTESGIVETPAARQGARSERERELVSLDELIPGRGRAESDVAASAELGAEANLAAKGEHPANDAPESRREAVSLADLARSSVSRRSQDVSSIAKESMAVARTHTGVARRVQAADAAANLPSVVIAPSAADPPTEPPARARSANQGPIIGAAIALVGIAAGFAFYIAGQRAPEPLVITQMVPNAAAPASVPATAAPVSPGATEQVEPLAAAEPPPVTPTAAEVAAAPAPTAAAGTPRAGGAGLPQASSRVAPEKIVLGEDAPGVRAEKIVLDEDPTPSAPATKPAPANEAPPLKPAVSSGGLPDRPSAGAVQAAVGSVLGAARSCLAGQLEPSSARVVFASDGSVQAVQVSGPAAGTPAGSCIESAFKKARVQPFAAPTFSFGTKVRPP